ncbi:PHAX domain-containing protein, putative [Plasmodium yoelii]|uniref:PHAX domain-containing protein n=2 Tax=Plasmodium yoelii TaxID=5861 RepID=A0AAE9WR74_PLAYO|nr:PHAX domain-containing protein, putative [Plasmodium yoelii]WBY55577.1 PHAX domain-containing protein [Plasmodium yoelii yoelii]CDU16660.1 conserved Plasmodium protein, unknown function [Plasmodium yoelii]VTZ74146.1 PHAX domain-containing protein, putative [Plasmodium yoelii]|eukprot:XP_729847.2 PHAX domain-containing protein, putative [Plasmodium yoelii]
MSIENTVKEESVKNIEEKNTSINDNTVVADDNGEKKDVNVSQEKLKDPKVCSNNEKSNNNTTNCVTKNDQEVEGKDVVKDESNSQKITINEKDNNTNKIEIEGKIKKEQNKNTMTPNTGNKKDNNTKGNLSTNKNVNNNNNSVKNNNTNNKNTGFYKKNNKEQNKNTLKKKDSENNNKNSLLNEEKKDDIVGNQINEDNTKKNKKINKKKEKNNNTNNEQLKKDMDATKGSVKNNITKVTDNNDVNINSNENETITTAISIESNGIEGKNIGKKSLKKYNNKAQSSKNPSTSDLNVWTQQASGGKKKKGLNMNEKTKDKKINFQKNKDINFNNNTNHKIYNMKNGNLNKDNFNYAPSSILANNFNANNQMINSYYMDIMNNAMENKFVQMPNGEDNKCNYDKNKHAYLNYMYNPLDVYNLNKCYYFQYPDATFNNMNNPGYYGNDSQRNILMENMMKLQGVYNMNGMHYNNYINNMNQASNYNGNNNNGHNVLGKNNKNAYKQNSLNYRLNKHISYDSGKKMHKDNSDLPQNKKEKSNNDICIDQGNIEKEQNSVTLNKEKEQNDLNKNASIKIKKKYTKNNASMKSSYHTNNPDYRNNNGTEMQLNNLNGLWNMKMNRNDLNYMLPYQNIVYPNNPYHDITNMGTNFYNKYNTHQIPKTKNENKNENKNKNIAANRNIGEKYIMNKQNNATVNEKDKNVQQDTSTEKGKTQNLEVNKEIHKFIDYCVKNYGNKYLMNVLNEFSSNNMNDNTEELSNIFKININSENLNAIASIEKDEKENFSFLSNDNNMDKNVEKNIEEIFDESNKNIIEDYDKFNKLLNENKNDKSKEETQNNSNVEDTKQNKEISKKMDTEEDTENIGNETKVDTSCGNNMFGENNKMNITIPPGLGLPDINRALLHGAYLDNITVVRKCLEKVADINYYDKIGRRALHYACAGGYYDICELLIKNGAKVNVSDYKNWTPLHIAVTKMHKDITELLLKNNANIHALLPHSLSPNRGKTTASMCIHFAAIKGNKDITKLLLKYGAKINDTDLSNRTALHYAAYRNNSDYLKFLIYDEKADINIFDVHNRLPIHSACLGGVLENVKILAKNKSFIQKKDIYNMSPLDIARIKKFKDIKKFLTKYVNENFSPNDPNGLLNETMSLIKSDNVDEKKEYIEINEPENNKNEQNASIESTKNENVDKKDIEEGTKNVHSDAINSLEIVDENKMDPKELYNDNKMIKDILTTTISTILKERNKDQIKRVVDALGVYISLSLLEKTILIQNYGGIELANKQGKRTTGGIFFYLIKYMYKNDIISKFKYDYIVEEEKEKKKTYRKLKKKILQEEENVKENRKTNVNISEHNNLQVKSNQKEYNKNISTNMKKKQNNKNNFSQNGKKKGILKNNSNQGQENTNKNSSKLRELAEKNDKNAEENKNSIQTHNDNNKLAPKLRTTLITTTISNNNTNDSNNGKFNLSNYNYTLKQNKGPKTTLHNNNKSKLNESVENNEKNESEVANNKNLCVLNDTPINGNEDKKKKKNSKNKNNNKKNKMNQQVMNLNNNDIAKGHMEPHYGHFVQNSYYNFRDFHGMQNASKKFYHINNTGNKNYNFNHNNNFINSKNIKKTNNFNKDVMHYQNNLISYLSNLQNAVYDYMGNEKYNYNNYLNNRNMHLMNNPYKLYGNNNPKIMLNEMDYHYYNGYP